MKSRGKIIKQFTASNFYEKFTLDQYINSIVKDSNKYNPFNLILGNLKSMNFYFVDVFHGKCTKLHKGHFMGFSNNLFFHSKWKKVEDGIQKF